MQKNMLNNKTFKEMSVEEFSAYVEAEMEKDRQIFEEMSSSNYKFNDSTFDEFDKKFEEAKARIEAENEALEKKIEEINREIANGNNGSSSSSSHSNINIMIFNEQIRIHEEMRLIDQQNILNTFNF